MALSRQEIEALAAKLIAGTITSAEQEQLNRWLDEQIVKDRYEVETSFAENADVLRQRMLARILEQASPGQPARKPHSRKKVYWAAAAAVTIILASTVWFFSSAPNPKPLTELTANDILPGGNRAVLSLADGRTVELSKSQSGIVIGKEVTYADGSKVIERAGRSQENDSGYQLSTPKGGTYRVTLPDSTIVWLNAASTLKYPGHFDHGERVVELTGEGYFDVKPRKTAGSGSPKLQPFKVITPGQIVEVLGTEFNISAYSDESATKTTVVKGLVRVAPTSGQRPPVAVNPGQQAVTRGADTDVQTVEPEQYTAWRAGYFYFDGLPPRAAFDQLARWYDLDVMYQGEVPEVKFFGIIERSKPLGSILNILGKSGLRFEVKRVAGRNQLIVFNESSNQ